MNENNNDWLNDPKTKTWFNGLKPRTTQNYKERYPQWLEFINMTPSEQIQKRLQNLTSQDLTERTFFEHKWREFKNALEKKYSEHATVTTVLTSVASFFGRNDLPLALKKGDWKSTQPETKVIKRPKVDLDAVKSLYAHASLRDKNLLLILSQSGLSEIDASQLKIEDITTLYTMPQTEHYVIEKPRNKTQTIQATCLSYEFLHDLRSLLAERGNPTSGYIFTSQTRQAIEIDEKTKKPIIDEKTKKPKLIDRPIEVRRINEAMKALAEKTFGKEKAKLFKTKALRSFFNSALLRADIKSEVKDLFMGHARLSARGSYDYDEFTIREAYTKIFENLSINGIQSREDLAELRNSFNVTKTQLAELITELKERNDKLEAKLTELGVDVNSIKKTIPTMQTDIKVLKEAERKRPEKVKLD